MKRLFAIICILLLFCFSPVYAGVPLDSIEANVNKVLDVLRDPKLTAPSAKEIKKKRLRTIYDDMFNKVELSRRTLARNWNKLNAAQRKEFVQLFQQVLEKAYIDKILDYTNEKIVFDKETTLSENQVEIQSSVVTASKVIPISYRMILVGSSWRVYDVVVENVSLVQNYRTQFNEILEKNTPEQMLEILRKKVNEQ